MRKLTIRVPDQVYAEAQQIRREVRATGHAPPSMPTLIGALIHNTVGYIGGGHEQSLEEDVIAPYRLDFEEVA